ncbi:hypothetical protein ACFQ0M_48765 [Kitasatospora aburaviensis]|uniref:Large Ala/Glu-rich protein n=1 Tax=Kitasatospora aburaviensis TaxID=67265 RepID=A0ABW1F3J1_9ACTN
MTDTENTLTTDDADTAETCAYPGCQNARESKDPAKTGPAPKYCTREDHNSVSAWRAKRSAAKATAGGRPSAEPEEPTDSRSPVTDALSSAAMLRGTIEQNLSVLLENVPKWLEDLRTAANPEAAEAQIEEATNNALRMVAAADERTATEKQLRIAAVTRVKEVEAELTTAITAANDAVDLLDKKTEAYEAELTRLQEQDEQRAAALQEKLAELEADRQRLETEFAEKTSALEEAAEQRIAQAKAAIEAEAAKRIADAEKAAEDQRKLAEKAAADRDEAFAARDEAVAQAEEAQRAAAEAVTAAEGKVTATNEATEKALKSMRTDVEQARSRITALETAQDNRNTEVERILRERGDAERRAGRAELDVERLQMLLAQHGIADPHAQA